MPRFNFEYRHNGRRYSLEAHASSWEEAEHHLQSLRQTGVVAGEVIEVVPAGPLALPIATLWVWIRLHWLNRWRRRNDHAKP